MPNPLTLGWEVVPGYDLEFVDWWLTGVVIGIFAAIAIAIFLLVFFLGYRRMSSEERAELPNVKKQAKALKGKERKQFLKTKPAGTRTVLGWRRAMPILIPIFAVSLVITSTATPILYTFWPQIYATLFYRDDIVVNETTKLAAAEAAENVVTIEREGIVLMRNDHNRLPVDPAQKKKVNIFGSGAFGIFYGNGGSGEFATDYVYNKGKSNEWVIKCTKFEEAMAAEGFEYNPYLLNLCKNYASSGNKTYSVAESDYNLHASIATFGTSGRYEGIKSKWLPYEHEPGVAGYETSYAELDGKTLLEYSKSYSDTAIYCISRYGTEQYDLPFSSKMDELKLTNEEYGVLGMLKDNFSNVIVLLNTPGPIYLNDLEDLDVDTLLYVGHPGLTGTKAIAEVISGKTNPSGRLVDTWPYDLRTNPSYETFGRNSTRYSSGGATYTFSNYYEGIYVGYRYYTTRAVADANYNYEDYVRYSFGHGLSYTNFNVSLHEAKLVEATAEDPNAHVDFIVSVKNVGQRAGKYVIELYSTPPYYTGGIEKSARNLVAYQKTNVLEPNATESYELRVNLRDLASWDSAKNCYNLEHGEYQIAVRDNCWDLAVDSLNNKNNVFSFNIAEDVLYRTAQSGKQYSALFSDVERGGGAEPITYLSRADFAGTITKNADVDKVWGGSAVPVDNNNIARASFEDNKITEEVIYGQTLDKKITLQDMKNADWDDARWPSFLSQLSQNDMRDLCGAGEFGIPAISSINKPATSEGDGPASCYNSGTGHPSGVILASTWNNDAAELFGVSCGKEGSSRGMSGWYAPGMNIHRSPYAGRNFEYYSEDPLISGNMGGYTARGALSMGVYTYAKHFGLNEQETNRLGLNVWCSEQGIREVYLKPFEIYSDLGGIGMMSAFSSMGTTWAGASEALCTKLLRDEWDFHGVVITDYNNSNMPCAAGLRAGNDEWLIPASSAAGDIAGAIRATPHDINYYLMRSSKNVLYALAHSNAAWEDADFEAHGFANFRK